MKYYTVEVVCRSSERVEKVQCYSEYRDGELFVVPLGCDECNHSYDCYRCRVNTGRSIMEEIELKTCEEEGELLYN
ncbi:MAG: hypothetical protein J6S13_07325 [Clostridia bacterium]|nr:hypothetical protein [Clostridia bacterium]